MKLERYKNMILNIRKYLDMVVSIFDIPIPAIAYLISKNKNEYKNIWLICERGNDAKDNGYNFFKYIRENHPDINAYYLINKSNMNDFKIVEPLGNIIEYGSFKHKVMFLHASKLITAYRGSISPWNFKMFRKFFERFFIPKKYIFLQHGITKDDMTDILGKQAAWFDLFITGGKPEYEYILNNFGYNECEVVYTGFSRFDNLHEFDTKKQILIMPTWRNGIIQPTWIKGNVVSDEIFINSKYYKTYQSLLNNDKLIDILEKNNFNLIFYPHYEIQPYLKYFSSKSKKVILASKEKYDVQKLLKDSKLLITDFSSVYFDFAYMKKPLAYYQFDKEDFFKVHYKKGYFSYEEDGFGSVLEHEDEVIEFILNSFDNKFYLEKKYEERVDRFFELRDKENSSRIFNEILKL